MVCVLIIDFLQNICGCDYYIICFLYGNYTSMHSFMVQLTSKFTNKRV